MLRHHLIYLYRNFKRFKTTFFINLVGMSAGLSCGLLIYLWVADELSVDKFHRNDSRIFQVMTNQNRPDDIVTLGYGPAQLEDELPRDFPEIEYAVGSSGISDALTLSIPGKNLNAVGQFAGREFFNVFSFPLIHGKSNQVLGDDNLIVISEKMAKALFNSAEDAVGKTVEWQVPGYKEDVIVSGVFKNVPNNSSQQFDYVLSYEAYKEILTTMGSMSWGNHNAVTYVQLKKGTDLEAFNKKIENFVKKRDAKSILTLFAKKYSEGYLHGKYVNGNVVGGRITYVRLFSAIAVFIIVIACINFMNLATAKASGRIKEVGIKKALGAPRKTLISQYIGESMLMSFVSMGIALLIVDLLLPQFNTLTGKDLSLSLDANGVIALLSITLFSGLVAGSYPALYLSGFSPALTLKGRFQIPGGELWARKGLVVFQFTLAIVFIASVWIIYQQMELIRTKHLGFDKENIIHFKIEGNVGDRMDTFLEGLEALPGVVEASAMSGSVMGLTSFTTGSFNWKGMDPNVIIQFEHLGIYYDMIELLGIEMAQGRSFSRDYPSDTLAIILNETAIDVMGLKDPVGETFGLWGTDYRIVGVVKDFHFQSLHENVKPFFFRITPKDFNKVMVRLEAGKEQQVLAGIDSYYSKVNPGYAFGYQFLDKEYEAQYLPEQRIALLSRYFAGLAILISCLGLFGLASFTAERRIKEIGIRKVLGSSVMGIVYLLSNDFNKIVLAAVVIALPVSYFSMTMWLDTFAYKIDPAWWYFVGAGVIALLVAWITVAVQALKVAKINPVNCLKDE